MSSKFMDLKFTSPNEIARKMLKKGLQIRRNLESAVAETALFGVTRIAMDTPVDTGRARSNIAGEFGDAVDISGPTVNSAAVADGRKKSPTRLDLANLSAKVGGNVDYLPPLEFGHAVVVSSMGRKIAKKNAKTGKVRRVPGVAMFRKNIPAIRQLFRKRCREAVQKGLRGEGMGGGE